MLQHVAATKRWHHSVVEHAEARRGRQTLWTCFGAMREDAHRMSRLRHCLRRMQQQQLSSAFQSWRDTLGVRTLACPPPSQPCLMNLTNRTFGIASLFRNAVHWPGMMCHSCLTVAPSKADGPLSKAAGDNIRAVRAESKCSALTQLLLN